MLSILNITKKLTTFNKKKKARPFTALDIGTSHQCHHFAQNVGKSCSLTNLRIFQVSYLNLKTTNICVFVCLFVSFWPFKLTESLVTPWTSQPEMMSERPPHLPRSVEFYAVTFFLTVLS